jgi:hypothetical protein
MEIFFPKNNKQHMVTTTCANNVKTPKKNKMETNLAVLARPMCVSLGC